MRAEVKALEIRGMPWVALALFMLPAALGCPRPTKASCVDLQASPPGTGPNPVTIQNVSFKVFAPGITPMPNTRIYTQGSPSGPLTGLDAGFRLEATLPAASAQVDATLVHYSQPATLTILGATGASLGSATMTAPIRVPQTLTLSANGIQSAAVTAPADEVLLLRLCYQ